MKSLWRIVHSHWHLPHLTHVKIAFDGWSKIFLLVTFEKRIILLESERFCLLFIQCSCKQGQIDKESYLRVYQDISLIGTNMALQLSHMWLHKLDPPSERERRSVGLFWNVKLLCENIWNKHIRNHTLFKYGVLYIKISVIFFFKCTYLS